MVFCDLSPRPLPTTALFAAVNFRPRFTTSPSSVSTGLGESVTFTAVAVASPPPTLHWVRNGVVVPDSQGQTLTIDSVTVEDVVGSGVTCVATNSVGSTTSAPALVALRDRRPLILPGCALPPSLTVDEGTQVVLELQGWSWPWSGCAVVVCV
jgi:hypothetical protein